MKKKSVNSPFCINVQIQIIFTRRTVLNSIGTNAVKKWNGTSDTKAKIQNLIDIIYLVCHSAIYIYKYIYP